MGPWLLVYNNICWRFLWVHVKDSLCLVVYVSYTKPETVQNGCFLSYVDRDF